MRRKRHKTITGQSKPDWIILLLVMLLLMFGLIMVLDASIIEAFTQFNDRYHFVKLQAQWMVIGFVALFVAMKIPLKWIKALSQPAFIITLLLLIVVLIPGIGTKVQGARRWISLGGFVLQPSELVKLAAVIYMPSWLSRHQRLGPFIGITGVISFLLLLQPDLGTAIIIFTIAFSMYYVSGAPRKVIYKIIISALIGIMGLILSSPYRFNRLKTFLDPTIDPTGSSYHIRQVLISLGSGGLTGTGFGRSRQKFQYLPEATTDSIFAVIAEETGFIGAMVIIGIFLAIIIRTLKVIPQFTSTYAQLVAIGVISWIGIQATLNLAAMVSLVPLTGVPLPFISYGGSALVTTMTGVGLLLNTTRYRNKR